jgi:hypothetical protein
VVATPSRGGLVTRQIALRGTETGSRVTVRRAVMVGVPNAGTILADPDHMEHKIVGFTNAVSLLPSGPATEILEGVLTVVKVVGHAAATGLPGLAAMRPGGPFLDRLNGAAGGTPNASPSPPTEPKADALGALTIRRQVADAVLDRVFQRTANDLVVPDRRLRGGCPRRPPHPRAAAAQVRSRRGVTHTTYFGAPRPPEPSIVGSRPRSTRGETVRELRRRDHARRRRLHARVRSPRARAGRSSSSAHGR